MHEMSLVKSLLRQVEAIAEEHDASEISEICIELGPLSGVESDLVRIAFDQLVNNEHSMTVVAEAAEAFGFSARTNRSARSATASFLANTKRSDLASAANKTYVADVDETTLTRFTTSSTVLVIREVPLTVRCLQCEQLCELTDFVFRCHCCGSGRVQVVSGDQFHLVSVTYSERCSDA